MQQGREESADQRQLWICPFPGDALTGKDFVPRLFTRGGCGGSATFTSVRFNLGFFCAGFLVPPVFCAQWHSQALLEEQRAQT